MLSTKSRCFLAFSLASVSMWSRLCGSDATTQGFEYWGSNAKAQRAGVFWGAGRGTKSPGVRKWASSVSEIKSESCKWVASGGGSGDGLVLVAWSWRFLDAQPFLVPSWGLMLVLHMSCWFCDLPYLHHSRRLFFLLRLARVGLCYLDQELFDWHREIDIGRQLQAI